MQSLAAIDLEGACTESMPEPSVALKLPLSVIVPVKNEAQNLAACLASLGDALEIYVIDSQSTDASAQIARSFGANLIQFDYRGGWPKKRQWALNTLPLQGEWVLLLDADEVLTPALAREIRLAIANPHFDGYYIGLDMVFLGKPLRHCGAGFYKLSLFRRGTGHFECRTGDQDTSMCDMEVHEHVIVTGRAGTLHEPLLHCNVSSLSRYIQKHDQYSNWEAKVWRSRIADDRLGLNPNLFGSQAQRRRWLKQKFFKVPGSSVLLFLYRYLLCFGFLDGVPGLIYCGFQAIQCFHVKAKLYEAQVASVRSRHSDNEVLAEDFYVRH